MNRYSFIATSIYPTPNLPSKIAVGYSNIKYPEIALDFSDIYVYISRGDRYDTLAQEYYGDSTLWWIISIANPQLEQNSLYPPLGIQIRIPGNIGSILLEYDKLNEI